LRLEGRDAAKHICTSFSAVNSGIDAALMSADGRRIEIDRFREDGGQRSTDRRGQNRAYLANLSHQPLLGEESSLWQNPILAERPD